MKGQALIEVLLAIAMIAIIVSSITVVMTSSLSNAGYGNNQTLATQYAQEAVEVLRRIRSSNYSAFSNYNSDYCLDKGAQVLTSGTCNSPNVDSFKRSITLTKDGCSAGVTKATINVAWTDGKCSGSAYCHSSKLLTCLSTSNPIQGP